MIGAAVLVGRRTLRKTELQDDAGRNLLDDYAILPPRADYPSATIFEVIDPLEFNRGGNIFDLMCHRPGHRLSVSVEALTAALARYRTGEGVQTLTA